MFSVHHISFFVVFNVVHKSWISVSERCEKVVFLFMLLDWSHLTALNISSCTILYNKQLMVALNWLVMLKVMFAFYSKHMKFILLTIILPYYSQEHKKLIGVNELDAKVRYTQLCRSLKTYGITFFLVKVCLYLKCFCHIQPSRVEKYISRYFQGQF